MLVPALFYTGMTADKKPAWRMLLREYIVLVFFLIIFAIREGYSKHQDFLKLLGFAGCMFIIFNIYMTVCLLVSILSNLEYDNLEQDCEKGMQRSNVWNS